MKYKYLLFDWDGTLSHTLPSWLVAVRKGLQKRGINLSDREIVRDVMIELRRGLPVAGVQDVDACIDEIIELEEIKTIHLQPLHDTIMTTLNELSTRDLRRALVTNTSDSIITQSLELHKLHDFFHTIVTGDRVKKRKPHPEPVLTALTDLQAMDKKDLAIMIGDSITDIESAHAAGIKVAFHYPLAHEPYYAYDYIKELKPDFVIRNLSELLDMV